MLNKLSVIFLIGLISISYAAPVDIDSDEVSILSKNQPCVDKVAGTQLPHPTDTHKFLRCLSPDSFWIETCPDNLFYNIELDLCDWSTITETTTHVNDIVKFHPILFRGNKTIQSGDSFIPHHHKLPVRVESLATTVTESSFPEERRPVEELPKQVVEPSRTVMQFTRHQAPVFTNEVPVEVPVLTTTVQTTTTPMVETNFVPQRVFESSRPVIPFTRHQAPILTTTVQTTTTPLAETNFVPQRVFESSRPVIPFTRHQAPVLTTTTEEMMLTTTIPTTTPFRVSSFLFTKPRVTTVMTPLEDPMSEAAVKSATVMRTQFVPLTNPQPAPVKSFDFNQHIGNGFRLGMPLNAPARRFTPI